MEPIVQRYPGNPILTGADFPKDSGVVRVFNSGVAKFREGYIMACRVEDRALRNRIWFADSKDGYKFVPRPSAMPVPSSDPEFAEYTAGMYYDPRITEIDGVFYLMHAAHSGHGCRLSLFKTLDFEHFEWLGLVSESDNRNGVLFPEKINGLYARLDRPNTPDNFGVSGSPIHRTSSFGARVAVSCATVRCAGLGPRLGPALYPSKPPKAGSTSFTVCARSASRTTSISWASACSTWRIHPKWSRAPRKRFWSLKHNTN